VGLVDKNIIEMKFRSKRQKSGDHQSSYKTKSVQNMSSGKISPNFMERRKTQSNYGKN